MVEVLVQPKDGRYCDSEDLNGATKYVWLSLIEITNVYFIKTDKQHYSLPIPPPPTPLQKN